MDAKDGAGSLRVNEQDVEARHGRSPGGRFAADVKAMSAAFRVPGRTLRGEEMSGGRPFEVDLVTLPAGARRSPLHVHAAQWEYYIFVAGRGEMLQEGEALAVSAGDHVLEPPGYAHTVVNTGDEPLVFYTVADNPPVDVVHQIDSDKWLVLPGTRAFRAEETSFYDGEE